MKVVRNIVIGLVALMAIAWLGLQFYSNQTIAEERAKPLVNPSLVNLQDGTYQSGCELGPVIVKVESRVEDGRLVDIQVLEHQNGLGSQAASVIPAILDKGSLEVDTVSGATVSSLCMIRAVDNSLAP